MLVIFFLSSLGGTRTRGAGPAPRVNAPRGGHGISDVTGWAGARSRPTTHKPTRGAGPHEPPSGPGASAT